MNPDPAVVWNDHGVQLGNQGQFAEALIAFDHALAINPNMALAWSNKGWALGNQGRFEEALVAIDKALAIDQYLALGWNNKGWIHENLGQWEEALTAYDRTLALDKTHPLGWKNKTNLLGRMGRVAEAVQTAVAISLHFFEQGKYAEVLEACERALQLEPANAMAWNNKGTSLAKLGQREEALAAYDRALQIQPTYALAGQNKAIVLSELGRGQEAAATAITVSHYLCQQGKYTEALEACELALQFNSSNADAWNNKGVCLAALGRLDEALASYDRALQFDNTHDLARRNKTDLMKQHPRDKDERNEPENGIDMDTQKHSAEYWLSEGKIAMAHDTDKAIHAFRRAVEADPGHAPAWRSLGQLYLRTGQLDSAKEAFEEQLILARRAGDLVVEADALGELGHVADLRGDQALAEEQYRLSLEIYQRLKLRPGLAIRYRNLAQIHIAQGQFGKAIKFLNTALELYQSLGDKSGTAHTLSSFAVIAQMSGKRDEAIQLHSQALKLLTEIGDRESMAGELTNLGNIHVAYAQHFFGLEEQQHAHDPASAKHYASQKLQQLTEAERRLTDAKQIATELGHKENQAVILGNLGRVYRLRNDTVQAESTARQALALYEEIGAREGIAVEWTNLGAIYLEANKLQRAFEAFQHAQEIARAVRRIDLLAEITKELGILFARSNDFGRACQYWRESKQHFIRLRNDDELAYIKECMRAAGCAE